MAIPPAVTSAFSNPSVPSTGTRKRFEVRTSRPVQLRIGKAAPREYSLGPTPDEASLPTADMTH